MAQGGERNLHSIMVGFNLSVFAVTSVSLVDLHSIMVGFNRGSGTHSRPAREIYIPLWSDSIEADKLAEAAQDEIYIPLWSDSILMDSGERLGKTLFTFHYGRIQSQPETCHRACR